MIAKRLVLLTLLFAGLSFALQSSVAFASEEKADHKKEEKKEEKKGEGGEKKEGGGGPKDVTGGRFAGDPVYVHLSTMILPVITNSGAEQIVTLLITLEVKDFDAADQVHSNMPKVMDSLMRALYGGLGNGDLRNGQLIDVGKIKTRALNALAEVIGRENIKDVLIEAVAQRRL